MGAGVTKEGILQVTGSGSSTSVAIGQPINVNDAAVLNTTPVGTEYGLVVRPIGGTGGGAVTIANGADVNAGATTDTAAVTDTNATLSSKLRGLVKWAFERMPVSLGQTTMAASFPVVVASNQSAIPVNNTETRASTSTVTSVASSAINVTLLTSNTNRLLVTIFNESTQILYLKFGTTASLTSYTVQIGPSGYYEIPKPVYSGIIDGIWAAANGNARITELTV